MWKKLKAHICIVQSTSHLHCAEYFKYGIVFPSLFSWKQLLSVLFHSSDTTNQCPPNVMPMRLALMCSHIPYFFQAKSWWLTMPKHQQRKMLNVTFVFVLCLCIILLKNGLLSFHYLPNLFRLGSRYIFANIHSVTPLHERTLHIAPTHKHSLYHHHFSGVDRHGEFFT